MFFKNWVRKITVLGLALTLALVAGVNPRALAATQLPEFDVVVKLQKIEQTLTTIEQMMPVDAGQPMGNPLAMLRTMMQGTDWIDPQRAVVIGADLSGEKITGVALIPYQFENQQFQATFGATTGDDYYLIQIPPNGGGPPISKATESALRKASQTLGKTAVSAQLSVKTLLDESKDRIDTMLAQIAQKPQAPNDTPTPMTPRDLQLMFTNMLNLARQLDFLSLGVDINPENLTMACEAQAAPGTDLARLFVSTASTDRLAAYTPDGQISFKSLSYDVPGAFDLVNTAFGDLYRNMGIELSRFMPMSKQMTGDVAGSMSIRNGTVAFETIMVLKDTATAATFLEKEYLPAMTQYSEDIRKMLAKQTGKKIEPLFVRTPESRIQGHKVAGLKMRVPADPSAGMNPAGTAMPDTLFDYNLRMTTVNDLFLTAADDKRLGELIKIAATLKPQPVKGPWMTMEMDMAEYMNAVAAMMPNPSDVHQPIPQMGNIAMTVDLVNGKASATTVLRLDDIENLIAQAKNRKKSRAPSTMATIETVPTLETVPTQPPVPPAIDPARNSDYWQDKGALCTAYGNDKAAIRYFKKTLQLDPARPNAYFQMGIAHGELGQYTQALAAVNQALAVAPDNALYLYGRGRIYLLAGDRDKALEDFKQAAIGGNQDARNYLTAVEQIDWTRTEINKEIPAPAQYPETMN